ncbi:hypothetical protein ACAW74_21065 [Fibrella sp. WM1]|uniref:hypothetical protein n=1 Tax=Fibrella musci TaxID=3242485 RepID=UPI00352215D9
MSKTVHLLLLIFNTFSPFLSFSQKVDDYKILPNPQSGILGKPIQRLDIKNGIIQPMPVSSLPQFTYEILDGPSSERDYSTKFRNFVLPAFTKSKLRLSDFQINTIKIKALSPENFTNGKLRTGSSFAYDGITADTVKITVRTSKNFAITPAQIIDSLKSYMPNGIASTIVGQIRTVNINGKDSIERVVKIVNPNVFFKARFITYEITEPQQGGWESFSITFNPKTGNLKGRTNLVNLSIEGDGARSRTHGYYPEFSGSDDKTDQLYFFKVIGEENDLRLIFALDDSNNESNPDGYLVIKEIPFKTVNGKREYKLDYRTVHRFEYKDITKLVRIAVYAKQTSSTTIQVMNYEGNRVVTYMRYPGFRIKYIDKMQ